MSTSTTGTETITLGSALDGFFTFAEAGAQDADVVSYTIEDGTDFEIGTGTYTASGTTLSRDTVTLSKISGTGGTAKINLSGNATVFLTARAEDLLISDDIGTNVQAWDAQLDSLSSSSANGVSLVTAANYAAMRGLLDLEPNTDFYAPGGDDVAVADGGTGASTAASARTNLGLATVGQAEAEAGTGTTTRAWTAERVAQAIAALGGGGGITPDTVQATTSGTAFDFTGIAAGANRITVMMDGIDLSSSDDFLVQIGDSGGIETTDYTSSSFNRSAQRNSTSGYIISRNAESCGPMSGTMTLVRLTGDTWVGSHGLSENVSSIAIAGGGTKTLSAELTTVRLTRSGTNTFNAGQVNIFVE
jgi:hypothetical protein